VGLISQILVETFCKFAMVRLLRISSKKIKKWHSDGAGAKKIGIS
jgi:hypothetical protein